MLLDARDVELFNAASEVMDLDEGVLLPEVESAASPIADILVLSDLKIEKEHRGKRLGLVAIQETMKLFGRGACAYLKAWPTETEARAAYDKLTPSERRKVMLPIPPLKDRRRLARYYLQVPGLRAIKDGTHLVCPPELY